MHSPTIKALGGLLSLFVISFALLFLPAWTLNYWQAWLVIEFGTAAYAGFQNLCEPFRTVAWCVYLLAGIRNPPASVNRLQPTHHPRQIASDRDLAARQFLRVRIPASRAELVQIQPFGQFPRVDAVTLVPSF
jgi:hypothetical protein